MTPNSPRWSVSVNCQARGTHPALNRAENTTRLRTTPSAIALDLTLSSRASPTIVQKRRTSVPTSISDRGVRPAHRGYTTDTLCSGWGQLNAKEEQVPDGSPVLAAATVTTATGHLIVLLLAWRRFANITLSLEKATSRVQPRCEKHTHTHTHTHTQNMETLKDIPLQNLFGT